MRALMTLAASAALLSLSLAAPAFAGGPPSKGDEVKLNPQPEPPGIQSKSTCKNGLNKLGQCAAKVELNPQPEPPGIQSRTLCKSGQTAAGKCASKVELNPQPEPPGRH